MEKEAKPSPVSQANDRIAERRSVDEILHKAWASFSLHYRPDFEKHREALVPVLMACGEPERVAKRLVSVEGIPGEEARLKFFSHAAGAIAASIAAAPRERQPALLNVLFKSAPAVGDASMTNYYWNATAPAGAAFLSGCSAAAFKDLAEAFEKTIGLGNAVLFAVYRYETRKGLIEDPDFRKLLLSAGGMRAGPAMAQSLLAECGPALLPVFKERAWAITQAWKTPDIAIEFMRMLGNRLESKAFAMELALRESVKSKNPLNYLNEVKEYIDCLEEADLAFKDKRCRLSLDEPVLGQLEEMALRKFSLDIRLNVKTLKGMSQHPTLLRRFVKMYYDLEPASKDDIRTILKHCAKGHKPGLLKESERMLREFVLKSKGLPIDPDCAMKPFTRTLSCFNPEKRGEFLELKDEIITLSTITELERMRAGLRKRVGDALEMRTPQLASAGLEEFLAEMVDCLHADAGAALARGLIQPGEFHVGDINKVCALGKAQVANRLRKALKLRPSDATEVGGAIHLPAVRDALELDEPEHFEPLATALDAEMRSAEKFAAAQGGDVDMVRASVALIAFDLGKRLEAALSPDAGVKRATETITCHVVDRRKYPIDFLMLGKCRPSCIEMDHIDVFRMRREIALLKYMDSIPDKERFEGNVKLDAKEREVLGYMMKRGLVEQVNKRGKVLYTLSDEAKEIADGEAKPEPSERAMIDYWYDCGTVGMMVCVDERGKGDEEKPIGHMIGHIDYDGGLPVFGCNGFYLDEKHGTEGNYLNCARFNLDFAATYGFYEYRHSITTLQDQSSKGFLESFMPGSSARRRRGMKDDLVFEYCTYGVTHKAPSIATNPLKWIGDFFKDKCVDPDVMPLNEMKSTRGYLALRFKKQAEKEKGMAPFDALMGEEERSYVSSVKDARKEQDYLKKVKYKAFRRNVSVDGEECEFDIDGLLLSRLKKSRDAMHCLHAEVAARLPDEKTHLANRVVESFLAGRLIQWDDAETEAAANALSSGKYHFFNSEGSAPASKWIEARLVKPGTGGGIPALAGLKVAVESEAGPVEVMKGSKEFDGLVSAIADRLPEGRKGEAPRIAESVLAGSIVQLGQVETDALMNAFVNGKVFSYNGERVSLKWLVERSYFGKPMVTRVEMRLLKPEEYEKLIADTYKVFTLVGSIDSSRIKEGDFAAFYRDKSIAIFPNPDGVVIAVNWERGAEISFEEALITAMHGIGHAPLCTLHLPDLEADRNESAEFVSEGMTQHITLCALWKANKLYPDSGFDLLYDSYLIAVAEEMDEKALRDQYLRRKKLRPDETEEEHTEHVFNAWKGFFIARALKRNVDKETLRNKVLPEVLACFFSAGSKSPKEVDADIEKIVTKYLVPDKSPIVRRLSADTDKDDDA